MKVKIIADSISHAGKRITTYSLEYWRALHGELLTHRLFSRNSSSSRAIPIEKMVSQVVNSPSGPTYWGKNQKGMQASEDLSGDEMVAAQGIWRDAMMDAVVHAHRLVKLGVHKQIVNRILEPFGSISTVLTGTEFGNFYNVRYHKDAMPEIRDLAQAMYEAQRASEPVLLDFDQWHLPYVEQLEMGLYDVEVQKKISASRCARVSYMNHEGRRPSLEEDLKLFDRLMADFVKHPSPTEHQAAPQPPHLYDADAWMTGNFQGWIQYRKTIPGEYLPNFKGPTT